MRGAMELYQKWLDAGANPLGWSRDRMERELVVLGQVADVLDAADRLPSTRDQFGVIEAASSRW